MLATKVYDENRDTSIPRCVSEKDLPAPPSLRKSRKHRPAPLDLSPAPQRQHLSPLDNPNALEEYLFSSSPASANSAVGMGMLSPAHYSQTDLLNILDSNPPLTPIPPLRTAPLPPDENTVGLNVHVEGPEDVTAPLSPGLPPLHAEEAMEGPFDEIFLELLHTETSFLSEVETIEIIVREILNPLGVVEGNWINAVAELKTLHTVFVGHLSAGDRAGITLNVLKTILKWPTSARGPYRGYITAFRLGLDALFTAAANDSHITRLAEIKSQIVPEGSEQVTLDYLFKRPLVRLRYYSKLYKYWTHFPPQIIDRDHFTSMGKDDKNELSAGHDLFKTLVSTARSRVSAEKLRLQGEPPSKRTPATTSQSPTPEPQPVPTLASLLEGVDCSRCRELTNTNSKEFSMSEFLESNPGEPVFHTELYTSMPDAKFPSPPRQASHVIILPQHLVLLGLTTPPSSPKPSQKWLIFPPIFGAALNIFTTSTYIEIILGGGANVRFEADEQLEQALRELKQRGIQEEGGRSPRPKEFLKSPTLPDAVGGGMRRSPAMGLKSPELQGWTVVEENTTKSNVTRGWSFEMRPRANTEPPIREPPSPPKEPQHKDNEEEKQGGHARGGSVSLVRGVLKMSPTPSPTPSPPNEPETEVEEEDEKDRQIQHQWAPPPKMGTLRRGSSPIRRGTPNKPHKSDTLTPNYNSPILSPIPKSPSFAINQRSPSLPKDPFAHFASIPTNNGFPRSPSMPQRDHQMMQQLPPLSRPSQPRSISPSRSVPAQLTDLPHFPTTPTKHNDNINNPPILPVLEFGQSPLGMRNYLRTGGTSPRRTATPVDSSPLAKERYGKLPQSTSQQSLTPNSPMSRSPAITPQLSGRVSPGRVSPSPTVCTFPPRTMRLDENERLAGTRSVDDLRKIASTRNGDLQYRNSGSSGSGSVEDEDLSQMMTAPNTIGAAGIIGRVLHSGGVVVHFWKRGGWHRPEVQSDESHITVESFGSPARGGRTPKVVLRVTEPTTGQVILQHEILGSASIRRDSPSEVSIGCDIPSTSSPGKKEYYLFACRDPGEADGLYHSLNTGRYFMGGVSEEQLRQATSLFGRTTSFASSLATNSSVGSTISNFSLYDTPPLPTIPAEFSPLEEEDYPSQPPMVLEERLLVKDHKVKIFLRQDAGIWKNLGSGKLDVYTTGPEVRIHVIQPTKKNPSATLVEGRIFESGACERVGRTGVAVNLPSREGKISVYMLQSKNDKEAQSVFKAIRKGKVSVK